MKGVRRMVFALTSAVMTMACHGCVGMSPHGQVRSEPAVPPSLGMQMAAPAGFAGAAARPANYAQAGFHTTPQLITPELASIPAPMPELASILDPDF